MSFILCEQGGSSVICPTVRTGKPTVVIPALFYTIFLSPDILSPASKCFFFSNIPGHLTLHWWHAHLFLIPY